MNDHQSLITREYSPPIITPVIPLNFVYPGLSLAQIFSIARAYRKRALLIMFTVMTFTVVILTLWPRTYTAMVTLMVNYEVNDPQNGKELPIGQVGSYIATQVELMQTPEVLLAVVDRLDLTQNEDYAQGYRGDNSGTLREWVENRLDMTQYKDYAQGYRSENGTLREWVARKLAKKLAIYKGQMGSQLIYVTYSANYPAEAALVANTVAEIYKEQDHMRSTGPPGERARRYAEQLNDLKKKVEQAQQQVTAFQQRNSLLDQDNKGNVDVVLLATLEGHLIAATSARRAAEAWASRDQSNNDQALSSNLVQSLKAQLATQEATLAQLNLNYASEYPDILNLKSQIASTRGSLNSALQSYSDNASAGLIVARRQEQNLLQEVAEQRARILSKGPLYDEAGKYKLELESAQTVYQNALEAYDQIMFTSSGLYNNVSFVSRATPPVKASKPRVLIGLALGGIVAFLLGLGIPLGYELLNRRIRCRDDLERHHGIPVLVEFGGRSIRTFA